MKTRSRFCLLFVFAFAFGFTGCAVLALPDAPNGHRPARPLDPDLAALVAYDPDPAPRATLEVVRETDRVRHVKGRFPSACPVTGEPVTVTFEAMLRRGDEPRPSVLVVPILGGSYGISRLIADAVNDAGWHAFFVHREERLLVGQNDADDLERLFRRAVVGARRTIDWMHAQPSVDAAHTALVGVSLGAIVGTVLAASEPRIGRVVLVMGGGDLPTIVRDSREQPVHRYKIQRMDRLKLADDDALVESLRGFRLDPLAFAPALDPNRVLQVITRYDNRVPTPNQWRLWEALGQPRGVQIPSGHYTLAFYKDAALDAMRVFFTEGFAVVLP